MSTPDDRKPQPKRLPVNPRRHKVPPAQRKRVAIACNNCNVRRVKCSGDNPCLQCRSSSRQCEYPESQKSTTVAVAKTELETLRLRCAALEKSLEEAVPDPARRQALLAPHIASAASSSTPGGSSAPVTRSGSEADAEPDPEPDDRADGRWLHDPDGTVRYLGETSGATFLDYLKEFMRRVLPLAAPREPWMKTPDHTGDGETFIASLGQYQTHDSRPLYEPDVDPLWLPPQEEIDMMLAQLRFLIQDGNGTFPSGGIFYWWDGPENGLNEPLGVLTSNSSPPDPWDKHRHLAFYNAAFALVCHERALSSPHDPADAHLGEVYFKRAKMLVGNPLDARRWTVGDISTMALMSMYLIEMNRRDAACMYIGVAIHVAVIHGAFKGWVDERGKRVFWTLYIIDRWLSCLMGRPPTLLDDAIRLEMPMDVPSLPPAAGLLANVKLARITSYIVCNTYGIAPWDQQHQHYGNMAGQAAQYHVDRTMQMLQAWYAALPVSLQLGTEHLSTDPIVCHLHMSYNQLIILTARPIFFIAVKKAVAERYIGRQQQPQQQQSRRLWNIEQHPQGRHIRAGLAAARWNMRIGRWLRGIYGTRRRMFHAELHYVFNAAILIILETLVSEPTPSLDQDVQCAIGIFEDDSRSGSNYSKDCCRVLKDFSTLARRLTASLAGVAHGPGPAGVVPAAGHPPPPPLPRAVPDDGAVHPWAPVAFEHPMLGGGNVATRPGTDTPPRALQGTTLQGVAAGGTAYEGGNLYQELVNWMETDDLQLYSNFLI